VAPPSPSPMGMRSSSPPRTASGSASAAPSSARRVNGTRSFVSGQPVEATPAPQARRRSGCDRGRDRPPPSLGKLGHWGEGSGLPRGRCQPQFGSDTPVPSMAQYRAAVDGLTPRPVLHCWRRNTRPLRQLPTEPPQHTHCDAVVCSPRKTGGRSRRETVVSRTYSQGCEDHNSACGVPLRHAKPVRAAGRTALPKYPPPARVS